MSAACRPANAADAPGAQQGRQHHPRGEGVVDALSRAGRDVQGLDQVHDEDGAQPCSAWTSALLAWRGQARDHSNTSTVEGRPLAGLHAHDKGNLHVSTLLSGDGWAAAAADPAARTCQGYGPWLVGGPAGCGRWASTACSSPSGAAGLHRGVAGSSESSGACPIAPHPLIGWLRPLISRSPQIRSQGTALGGWTGARCPTPAVRV